MLIRIQFLLFFVRLALTQNASPCPSIFAYEPKGTEDDRWYGRITVTTAEELTGIWLRISLDKPAELLGNWFGEATSSDNRDYLIKNQHHRLQPNREPLSLRFFVKYTPGSRSIPSLTTIRLNGRIICPPGAPESSEGTSTTLHISQLQSTGSSTNVNQAGSQTSYTSRQSSQRTTSTTTEAFSDDDFFPGDLSGLRPTFVLANNIGIPSGSCGVIKTSARPLLIHGQNTVEGEWPWHTALYRYKGANLQYICGGSLITPNHVITAAHCVTKLKTSISVNPELLIAYLGKYNLYKVGSNVQNIQIAKITVHPEFNGTYLHNDIAVLQLEHAAEITDYVRTVCLWQDDISLTNIVERLGTVVGWGFDETGELTENLMMAKMPVVSTETCIFSNREFFSRFTTPKTFCAGFRNGTSACTGDSGGAMVFPRSGTSGSNTIWQIRGIISLSVALQNEKVVCDTSAYIVLTDVAKYVDWVRGVIR